MQDRSFKKYIENRQKREEKERQKEEYYIKLSETIEIGELRMVKDIINKNLYWQTQHLIQALEKEYFDIADYILQFYATNAYHSSKDDGSITYNHSLYEEIVKLLI